MGGGRQPIDEGEGVVTNSFVVAYFNQSALLQSTPLNSNPLIQIFLRSLAKNKALST